MRGTDSQCDSGLRRDPRLYLEGNPAAYDLFARPGSTVPADCARDWTLSQVLRTFSPPHARYRSCKRRFANCPWAIAGFWKIHFAGTLFFKNRSEEHTSELQSHLNLVCRLLLDNKI